MLLVLSITAQIFFGWQQQGNLRTVQKILEEALTKVAAHQVKTICAGRTDKGVHAREQVVHFNTSANRDDTAWILGVNSYLPQDISVKWIRKVDSSFNARLSAVKRHYRYFIYNNLTRPAILAHHVTWHYKKLSIDKMQLGAEYLLGKHDFSSFRSADCQAKTTARFIETIKFTKQTDDIFYIDIIANAFLHHMVRNIVGVLLQVGEDKQRPEWIEQVLFARNRKAASITADPNGLYLWQVYY